jgi:superfamily II DNA or RNA helicase
MSEPTRARRRRLSVAERRSLYERADGCCQNCGEELDATWHEAHLVAWSHGGATSLENERAWCRRCNLHQGAVDVPTVPFELRDWQAETFDDILVALHDKGMATVHAAPGAGKTLFAGAVYHRLREVGLVERLLVVVPNLVIRAQWKEALGDRLKVHLDDTPRDGWLAYPTTDGPVVTYANCHNAWESHRRAMLEQPTLVIFDEVHHLGDQKSWGRAAEQMVTDDDGRRAAAVLNTTGTLFRSKGRGQAARERIPTVAYREARDEAGRPVLEAVADVSVPASRLIGRELRPVDLYACGSAIEMIDLHTAEVIAGEVADLPDERLMRAAHARIVGDREWMDGFARHMLDRLAAQSLAIDNAEPLKALWVARDMKTAAVAAEVINRAAGTDFARLVTSEEPAALRTLRRAVTDRRPCCIVAVRMVTEGFDCAQVSTIAYASNYTAQLFLTQMVARAMRITPTERSAGKVLPAQLLIPDVPDLRRAFLKVLVAELHTIAVDDEDAEEGDSGREGGLRLPRYDLSSVTRPRLDDTVVVGEQAGTVTRVEVEAMTAILGKLGLGEGASSVYAARAVVASREFKADRILADRIPGEVTITDANPRDINIALRDTARVLSGWWQHKGDTPVAHFQRDANRAAVIDDHGRDNASEAQLRAMLAHMAMTIIRHCAEHDLTPPAIALRWSDSRG